MLRKIALGLGGGVLALVAVFVLVVSLQKSQFTITRSIEVNAPSAAIYPQISYFQNWMRWSPWAQMDPDAKYAYEGPEGQTGSSMSWSGNAQVGEGKMTITESEDQQYIKIKLEFIKPMQAVNNTLFTFEPGGSPNSTKVTWAMSGRRSFMEKAVNLLLDLDKLVGADFERGLEQLKQISEHGSL